MFRVFCLLAALLCGCLSGLGPGRAEPVAFAPFKFDPARPDVIELDGSISSGAALAFRRTLAAAPNARVLILNSPGGDVDAGLLIADDVHTRKLATLIPRASICASACAYIFLAGTEREAVGSLGVHQMSSDRPNLQSAQMSIADVIDILNRFDTPVDVLTIMFRTPPDEMHFFSADEVERYGINRTGAATVASADPIARRDRSPGIPAETPDASAVPRTADPLAPAPAARALGDDAAAALSTLESDARQPTRIAIYEGLDFFGDDVGSAEVEDAASCATKCFEIGGTCRAFTFNTATRRGRGPNCFLKAGRGEVDGNSAALSGELLSRGDRDAAPVTIDVIDPVGDLYKDVDILGLDLSNRPHGGTITEFACRRACILTDRCLAFTYLRPKKQCWLKSGVGTARSMAGAVTGGKKVQTFTPKTIALQ